MDISEFLTAALGIVTIATLAGLGFMRGTVINLRERLDDADKNVARADRTIKEQGRTIEEQSERIKVLESVVTNDQHWQALTQLVVAHQAAVEGNQKRIERKLDQILGEAKL